MTEVQNFLPEAARPFFIRVRNDKQAVARSQYDTKLQEIRADAAARNVLRSGFHELAEWKLSQEFLGNLAYSMMEAAIETCRLYEISIDTRLRDSIGNSIEEFLNSQIKNALQRSAERGPGAVKIPLSERQRLAGSHNLPRLNEIMIELERARVESQRKIRLDNISRSEQMSNNLTPEEFEVLQALAAAFPETLDLHELAPRTILSKDETKLLRVVDGLLTRGFLTCMPLRGNEGLVNAAKILISQAGINFLERSGKGRDTLESPSKATPRRPSLSTATVIGVLIASPTDVSEERDVVTRAIGEWNAAHRVRTGIMLDPIRWETHSFPESGKRTQGIVNRQIVHAGDCLIGIFGCRVGSPTGEAQSGTIEEIELFRKAGKHVSLYFSNAPVQRGADREQLAALEKYQQERKKDTLYWEFGSPEELHRLVVQHLPHIVGRVSEGPDPPDSTAHVPEVIVTRKQPLKLDTEFTGEYPDGPYLRVKANRGITAVRLDYLDERDVQVASDQIQIEGQDFLIPIDYPKLVRINNLKPRSGNETIPMGFRIHIADGESTQERKIPVALEQTFKVIKGTMTFVLKLLG
jgi:hypothetical protein